MGSEGGRVFYALLTLPGMGDRVSCKAKAMEGICLLGCEILDGAEYKIMRDMN